MKAGASGHQVGIRWGRGHGHGHGESHHGQKANGFHQQMDEAYHGARYVV